MSITLRAFGVLVAASAIGFSSATVDAGVLGGVYCCNHGAVHNHSAATAASGGELLTPLPEPASSDFTYFPTPTKWNPGANTASIFNATPPPQTPGGATWSIMGAGLASSNGTTSTSFTSLFSGDEVAIINAALNVWAAVSGFTNLGQVTDAGGDSGATGAAGRTGDIRIAAASIDGAFGTLASAFQPGTEAIFVGGNKAGDMTFDNGEVWSDDPTDTTFDADFDFFTVALHELGHALGLGHTTVAGSVMEPTYAGARRTLGPDDIAGIQAIYGLNTAVPEPAAIAMLSIGGAFFLRRRSRVA